jgi:hypothetical protein
MNALEYLSYVYIHLITSSDQDEELLNDACAALVTICEVSAANIQFVMEQGILSRYSASLSCDTLCSPT